MDLLKEDGLSWSESTQGAFEILKKAINLAPILALSNFAKTCILEIDASKTSIGAILS